LPRTILLIVKLSMGMGGLVRCIQQEGDKAELRTKGKAYPSISSVLIVILPC